MKRIIRRKRPTKAAGLPDPKVISGAIKGARNRLTRATVMMDGWAKNGGDSDRVARLMVIDMRKMLDQLDQLAKDALDLEE